MFEKIRKLYAIKNKDVDIMTVNKELAYKYLMLISILLCILIIIYSSRFNNTFSNVEKFDENNIFERIKTHPKYIDEASQQ